MSCKHCTTIAPGPWRWGPDKMDAANALIDCQGRNVVWAMRYDDELAIEGGNDGWNARVIAAAPEMLDALEGLVDCLDALNWPALKIPGLGEKARALVNRVKAGGPAWTIDTEAVVLTGEQYRQLLRNHGADEPDDGGPDCADGVHVGSCRRAVKP